MTPWFTVERIDDATFALSEYRHWEETHSYLLLGRDRALLLDTGLGVGDLRREVEALTDRPVTVALTHVHWDHIGGCGQFAAPAVHAAEADWLRHFPLPEAAVRRQLCAKAPSLPDFPRKTTAFSPGSRGGSCGTGISSILAGGRSRCSTRRDIPRDTAVTMRQRGGGFMPGTSSTGAAWTPSTSAPARRITLPPWNGRRPCPSGKFCRGTTPYIARRTWRSGPGTASAVCGRGACCTRGRDALILGTFRSIYRKELP